MRFYEAEKVELKDGTVINNCLVSLLDGYMAVGNQGGNNVFDIVNQSELRVIKGAKELKASQTITYQ